MKMVHKINKNNNRVRKLSDYIMNFAFLYSSLICFSEAADKWQNNEKVLAIIITICGFFSFLAIFRWKIANLYYKIIKK